MALQVDWLLVAVVVLVLAFLVVPFFLIPAGAGEPRGADAGPRAAGARGG